LQDGTLNARTKVHYLANVGKRVKKIEIARVIGVDKSTVSGKLIVRPTGVIGGNDTKQQAKKAFRIFNTQREAGSNIV